MDLRDEKVPIQPSAKGMVIVIFEHTGIFLREIRKILDLTLDGLFALDRSSVKTAREKQRELQRWSNIIAANTYKIPFSHTPDVLTDATAEFAFFILGCAARKTWPSEQTVREGRWTTWSERWLTSASGGCATGGRLYPRGS